MPSVGSRGFVPGARGLIGSSSANPRRGRRPTRQGRVRLGWSQPRRQSPIVGECVASELDIFPVPLSDELDEVVLIVLEVVVDELHLTIDWRLRRARLAMQVLKLLLVSLLQPDGIHDVREVFGERFGLRKQQVASSHRAGP